VILPPEQYAYCFAAIKDGEFNEGLNKLFKSHPQDFAVRQELAEIFILQCDFTDKITHPSRVTNFRALLDPQTHAGTTRQCVKKKNIEIRNGVTSRRCDLQKCSNLIDRKSFVFLRHMLEKSPQYRHFTREIADSENAVLLCLTRFLVDPLPVLESP